MNYCSTCGSKVTYTIPDGDDRPRFVCRKCGTIHYSNPQMVVGALPEFNNRLLFCRRAIEPARGKWTLPAGYLENGETVADCAIRETWEEAGARICNLKPYTLINLPFINQVYFMFRAQMEDNLSKAGDESLETRFMSAAEIPWDELSFDSIREVLKLYCSDLKTGLFPFRIITIDRQRKGAEPPEVYSC